MPPIVLTLETLPVEIDKALPKLNAVLADFQHNHNAIYRQVFVRDGNLIKTMPQNVARNPYGETAGPVMPPGLFTITFETTPVPTLRMDEKDDGVNIRQITLHFNGDRKVMPPRARTKFYFIRKLQGGIDSRKLCEKLTEMAVQYRIGVESANARIVAEAKAKTAADLAAKALDARKIKMKETAGKRDEVYAQLVEAVVGYKIESQLAGSYLNLALPNNIRVKIAVDTDRVFITEIDTPIYFDKEKMAQIAGYLAKIGAL